VEIYLTGQNRICYLELDDWVWEELINEFEVVWLFQVSNAVIYDDYITYLKLLNIRLLVSFAIQIKRIEFLHRLQHPVILLGHELPISASAMPWVERVISYHRQRLVRKCGLFLYHQVQVLVMAPAQHHIIHPASGRIYPVLGTVYRVLGIWVVDKSLG